MCLNCHSKPEDYLYQSPEAVKNGLSPRQQVFDLYKKVHDGFGKLNARERYLLNGEDYTSTVEEAKEAEEIVDKLHIKKKQLSDCYTCHR